MLFIYGVFMCMYISNCLNVHYILNVNVINYNKISYENQILYTPHKINNNNYNNNQKLITSWPICVAQVRPAMI